MLWQLPEDLTRDGVVAVGYSMGGAMLLKYLGEEGSFSPLRAAATICAPIDLIAQRASTWSGRATGSITTTS